MEAEAASKETALLQQQITYATSAFHASPTAILPARNKAWVRGALPVISCRSVSGQTVRTEFRVNYCCAEYECILHALLTRMFGKRRDKTAFSADWSGNTCIPIIWNVLVSGLHRYIKVGLRYVKYAYQALRNRYPS
jgi:hypothetical protein